MVSLGKKAGMEPWAGSWIFLKKSEMGLNKTTTVVVVQKHRTNHVASSSHHSSHTSSGASVSAIHISYMSTNVDITAENFKHLIKYWNTRSLYTWRGFCSSASVVLMAWNIHPKISASNRMDGNMQNWAMRAEVSSWKR